MEGLDLDIIQRIEQCAGLDGMDIVERIQNSLMVGNEFEEESKDEGNSERKEEKENEELTNVESDKSDKRGQEDEENDNGRGHDDDHNDDGNDSENNITSFEDNQIDGGDEANGRYVMNASLASFAVAKAFEIRGRQYLPHQRLIKMKGRKRYLDLPEPCYGYLLVVS